MTAQDLVFSRLHLDGSDFADVVDGFERRTSHHHQIRDLRQHPSTEEHNPERHP